jgi:hypothetical protein
MLAGGARWQTKKVQALPNGDRLIAFDLAQ